MKRTETTIPAKALGLVGMAFHQLKGDRPVMLSYRIGRIMETAGEMQRAMIERLQPYMEGGQLREERTPEEEQQVQEILEEEITLHIPVISIGELEEAGLTVKGEDDTVLTFLIQHGILSA